MKLTLFGLPHFLRPGSLGLVIASITVFWATAALGLSFEIESPPTVAAPGQTLVYRGTVTNASITDLLATDMFFNFFSFDPLTITAAQLLGNPDFPIPSGTTSPTTDLFSIQITDTAVVGETIEFSVFLQDVNGNESPDATFSLVLQAQHAVPEPSTLALVLIALPGFILLLRKTGLVVPRTPSAVEAKNSSRLSRESETPANKTFPLNRHGAARRMELI
jgi:hypothetical protein